MRKILTAIALTIAATAGSAGVAAADVPNATVRVIPGPNYQSASCTTPETMGVLHQYGAWGWYIDGCTTPRVYCPPSRRCAVDTVNFIWTRNSYGYRVTQNARVRVFTHHGTLRYFHDRSCAGNNTCTNRDSYGYLYGGESATTQCNGVRENKLNLWPLSYNHCEVKVTYL